MTKYPTRLIALAASALLALSPAVFAGADHGHGSHEQPGERTADGVGEVRSVAEDGTRVHLRHEPIRALRWPAMAMTLPLADPKLTEGLEEGAKVEFTLRQTGATDYEIIRIVPVHDH